MMEEMYGLHPAADCPEQRPPPPPQENMLSPPDYHALTPPAFRDWFPIFGSGQMFSVSPAESDSSSMVAEIQRSESEEEISDIIRTRIASHPLCPKLLDAYIDCQKVGASPEIVNLLDEIRRENDLCKRTAVSTSLGTDPELDEFMEAYCNILTKCKSDLARPFEEATSFFNNVERQLSNLCDGTSRISVSDEAAGSFDESFGEGLTALQEGNRTAEDQELKEKLTRKYSGYISCLKHEFSKKKKKGKLPKESTKILLDWWTAHYKWPYPTEADKIALAESTGLDQKQINNWFINQRKRHWKPSGDMQHAVIDSLYGPFFMNDGS